MRIFLFGALLLLLSACSSVVSPPEVTFKDLKIIGAGTSGVNFDVILSVKNPNPFDIKLEGYTYSLKIMDLPLANGGVRETYVFSSPGETDVRIPVKLSYTDLGRILQHRPDPDRIPYQLSAGLEVATKVNRMYIPVEKSGVMSIPKEYRPAFYLQKLRNLFDRQGGGDAEEKE